MNTMLKSWIKVFAATVLSLFLVDGADVFGVDWTDLRTYLAAGVASVLPLIITWLDPNDPRFGRNA
jgi:microsomal dipeptidase-like Zn-dependent dipeptidase